MRPVVVILTLLMLLPFGLAGSERLVSWRGERVPGSARLALDSLRVVVLPADAGEKLAAAVEDLRMVFFERVGVELNLAARDQKQAIFLRLKTPADSTGSFSIRRKHSRIVVSANSENGLVNGIYALCGDLLGARWYWAGELGLEYVGTVPDKFPLGGWSERPAFIQRTLYPADGDFGRQNRLVRNFQFNHALAKIFDADLYAAEPEVFSLVQGRKRIPEGHAGLDPQPNFAVARTAEIAAEAALAHFEAQPNSRSFSLSINDNTLFDESPATQRLVEPLRYFRTRPDYTDYVFGFMNTVAEKVFNQAGAWQTEDGEDRYLTALAYYWTEAAPSIQLHPRVMPVLTSDRAQWHDPEYRAEDKALIERWVDSGAERVATWDYYFGSPYPYPRQFNEWIDESIKYLHCQGVDVFFSQLPSAWGMDGGKAWLTAELLWDPHQDAGVLLDEYYTNFFGAAAEPMRRFYESAEVHRNENEGKADWIKFYKDEAGVELFPAPLLREMRTALELAKELVVADARRLARVEVVSEAFAFTEIYAAFHQARVRLVEAAILREDRLATLLSAYERARDRYLAFAQNFTDDPMHSRMKAFTTSVQTDPRGFALAVLAETGAELPEPAMDGLAEWGKEPQRFRSILQNVSLEHAGQQRREFLGPLVPLISGWYLDYRPSEHLQVTGLGDAGGIRVSGADILSFFRDQPVLPERTYLLDATAAWQVSPDNRTQIRLTWTDRDGERLRIDSSFRFPWGTSGGSRRIVIPFESPVNAYNVRIHFVTSRQDGDDFIQLEEVDFGTLQ